MHEGFAQPEVSTLTIEFDSQGCRLQTSSEFTHSQGFFQLKKKAGHRSSRLDGITRIVRIHAIIKSKLGIQIHTISRGFEGMYTMFTTVRTEFKRKQESIDKKAKKGRRRGSDIDGVVQGSCKGV